MRGRRLRQALVFSTAFEADEVDFLLRFIEGDDSAIKELREYREQRWKEDSPSRIGFRQTDEYV